MTADEEVAYIAAMSRDSVVRAYSSWTDLSPEEALLLERYVPPGAKVLDLGCGTGRIAGHLRDRGCSYVGVDASTEMIEAAKKLHPELRFHVQNLVDFAFAPGDFDVVLMMHNVIDSLSPYGRRRSFLQSCRERLAGGSLIFSSHLSDTAPAYVAEDYHGTTVHNFRAPHGWHVSDLEELGFQVLLSLECGRDGHYDWSYFVARQHRNAPAVRTP